MDISSACARLGNYSVEEFELDVRTVAKNGASITKASLIECLLLDPASDLSLPEIEQILTLIGQGDVEAHNTTDLATALLAGVCNPPGVFEIAAAREPRSAKAESRNAIAELGEGAGD
mmetsp:Transcript_31615/g.91072  ORF Transcript_31615/g.91072 Transcript_31615/m.91072 type:complete len:118 (+) Transcript_31615:2-355(+)